MVIHWVLLIFLPLGFVEARISIWGSVFNAAAKFLDVEICNDDFISPDFFKLESDLKSLLFGQNIIIEKLVPILRSHFTKPPKKALVICMHGWTGSGKNYGTSIVINNIYRKSMQSKFIQFFSGRLHFPIDEKKHVDQYKVNIQTWIKGNVTQCPRSLFVFDEVDKIPSGVLDAIKPFLDYHDHIDSIDYRKSIFIFISNIGGGVINRRFTELWRQGQSRLDMKYKDFEPYLRQALYNTKGGFHGSSILEGHLVSLYLPFLPLEEEQVRLCIKAEIERQNVRSTEEDVEALLNEMEFSHDRFSTSGCKRVSDLVSALKYHFVDEL